MTRAEFLRRLEAEYRRVLTAVQTAQFIESIALFPGFASIPPSMCSSIRINILRLNKGISALKLQSCIYARKTPLSPFSLVSLPFPRPCAMPLESIF